MATVFITAIDTTAGKTVATGLIAMYIRNTGRSVITLKLVQTGCSNRSEDIATHRSLMGIAMTDDDKEGLTCPYVFKYPASPHLAASMENAVIDPAVISASADKLAKRYSHVLIEGVGGIEVPMTESVTTLDYIADQGYPVIVVTSPALGSINHTLLTLRAARARKLDVLGLIYNRNMEADNLIAKNSRAVFDRALNTDGHHGWIIDLPHIQDLAQPPHVDFSPLLADMEDAS